MARAASLQRRTATTAAGWIVGFLIFFPILWMVLTSFKTELEAFSTPPKFLFFHWTLENFGDRAGAVQLSAVRRQLDHPLPRLDPARPPLRRARRLGHGLLAGQAHEGRAALDALHQDDAAGRRPDPDLSPVQEYRAARFPRRADRGGVPDQPADHRLDALHLFQGDPGRDPGGRAHGRRHAVAGDRLCADAHGHPRHRLDLAAQCDPGLERGLLDA